MIILVATFTRNRSQVATLKLLTANLMQQRESKEILRLIEKTPGAYKGLPLHKPVNNIHLKRTNGIIILKNKKHRSEHQNKHIPNMISNQ